MPRTPAMTTPMMFFMTRPGDMTPMEHSPTPPFAVPYAAPRLAKTSAEAQPIQAKKDAVDVSMATCPLDDMIARLRYSSRWDVRVTVVLQ
jgi:hypothetical protein